MTKKKTKLKKLPLIILIVVLLLTCCGVGGFFLVTKTSFFHKDSGKKVSVQKKKLQKEDVDYEAKVFMVGDALIHWGVYNDALQGDGSYDFKPMLQYVKPMISKYDLAYYNQETVLGGTAMGLSSYPRFNSPQECGDAFIDAGFSIAFC